MQVMQDCGLERQKGKKNVAGQDAKHTNFSLHIKRRVNFLNLVRLLV